MEHREKEIRERQLVTAQSLTELEANKQLVSRLFEVIYGTGDNLQILDEVVAEDYVQHNPLAGEGARAFASSSSDSSRCQTGSTRGAPWS